MTLPAFPVHGPSKRDRLLCCWPDDDIIDEHGNVLGSPTDIDDVMDILIEHHAILLTTHDLQHLEENAMIRKWQVYRVGDDAQHGIVPKVIQISCRRGKNTGTIALATAWFDA